MILCEDYNKTFKNYRIVDSKYFMYNDQLLLELENDIELKTIPPHKVSKQLSTDIWHISRTIISIY